MPRDLAKEARQVKTNSRVQDIIDKVQQDNEHINVKNFQQLQDAPVPTQNEFFLALYNTWTLEIMDGLDFIDPYARNFRQEAWPWSDGIGITNLDITKPNTWVKPTPDTKKTYNELPINVNYIYTEIKDYYQEDLSRPIIQGALSGPSKFDDFVTEYRQKLLDSIMIRMRLYIGKRLVDTAQNKRTVPNDISTTDLYKDILATSLSMSVPSTDYNPLGYYRNTKMSDQVLIVNAKRLTNFNVDVIASLFNSNKIDVSMSFRDIIIDNDLPDTILYLIESVGYRNYSFAEIPRFEIPFEFYPQEGKGLVVQYFINYWTRTGRNPGANSILVQTAGTPTPTPSDIQKVTFVNADGTQGDVKVNINSGVGTTAENPINNKPVTT